jgi:hypothetical protein
VISSDAYIDTFAVGRGLHGKERHWWVVLQTLVPDQKPVVPVSLDTLPLPTCSLFPEMVLKIKYSDQSDKLIKEYKIKGKRGTMDIIGQYHRWV